MTVVDTLTAARREFQAHGGRHGYLKDSHGKVCALGAIASVLGILQPVLDGYGKLSYWIVGGDAWDREGPAREAVLELAKHCPPSRYGGDASRVTNFNDRSTYGDVLNLFEKALADLGALG